MMETEHRCQSLQPLTKLQYIILHVLYPQIYHKLHNIKLKY